VEFENQGHNYVVTREITKDDSDGELLEDGESKAIGRHVYNYVKNRAIGLDWEGFRKSTVVLQGEMSALTDLNPEPRKEAFTQLFGLGFYFRLEGLAKDKAKDREGDIRATEEANKILQADVEKIPGVKKQITQLKNTVKRLTKKKERLDQSLRTGRSSVDALEQDHNEYIRHKEKLDGIQGQISEAQKDVNKNKNELNRLLSIEGNFDALKQGYATYSSLESKHSQLRPAKSEYDKLTRRSDKLTVELRDDNKSLGKTLTKIKTTRSTIAGLRRQIPSASKLSKAKNDLKRARDEEKGLKESADSLRGQIRQIGTAVTELESKKFQVKGKDKCPVCLQKITDPQHVLRHYDDEIAKLNSDKSRFEKARKSAARKLTAASARVGRCEKAERELSDKASLAGQVQRELKRLSDLAREQESTRKQKNRLGGEIAKLTKQREGLNFDPAGYNRIDAKVRQYRKARVAENFANAKTELDRLPKVRQELQTTQDTLSGLVESRGSLRNELERFAKAESNYVKAKKQFDKIQKEANANGELLAAESQKERQANERLSELEGDRTKLNENLKQIERFRNEITTLEELSDVFKNIPENILRRLRPFIEKEGTDIINSLSDSELTALNIEEDTLNVAATTNGEIRPIHYFSGGQKTRINMALRVAISRILSRMPQTEEHTFAIMQTLFIDEGDFGNLDEAGIRDAVSVIRNLTKEFDRVILISHVDAIREIFHGYIVEVRKTGLEESAIAVPVERMVS
jgi:DNA repair protein SbcC/Rad50